MSPTRRSNDRAVQIALTASIRYSNSSPIASLPSKRKKFAADATIWLYLCHGASDPRLFQEVANTFQVTAKGFTKKSYYCAPSDFPTSRKHKVAVLTTAKAINSCVNGDVDFKKLDTNTNVRTAQPQRP